MWVSVLTKGCQATLRTRQQIEANVPKALRRELRHLGSIVLTISPTTLGSGPGYRCRLRIWSPDLGVLIVNEVGHTVRSTAQQATTRARQAVRRRIHKQHSKYRHLKRNRFERFSRRGGDNFAKEAREQSMGTWKQHATK